MQVSYIETKEILARSESIREQEFQALKNIVALTNNASTHSQGRDLVIRSLANFEAFSDVGQQLLASLVRSTGLHPYLSRFLLQKNFEDRLAYEMHSSVVADQKVTLHSEQSKVLNLLLSGANVIFSAPTSVGKSLIVDAFISQKKPYKAVIIVPTIALIDETRRRFLSKFGESCKVLTHPSQTAVSGVCNLYVLTQERVLDRNDLDDVEFFVLDEFYKLNIPSDSKDRDRSVDLNLAFSRLASTGAQFYLLGPNIQSINGINSYDYCFVQTDFSTVAVDIKNFDLPTNGNARKNKLIDLCRTFSEPTIVYCQSPSKAAEVANHLIDELALPDKSETRDAAEWIAREYHKEWVVYRAIMKGVGIHHGGVPRALQQHFIQQFNDRKIQYLVCTSTIIEGVNTVAKNVVIYDRRKSTNLVDHFTYKNISGRAGRMNEYFVGNVFILEKPPEEKEYSVDLVIEDQPDETPLSLLLELPEESLIPKSKERILKIRDDSLLSIDTIRANRHVSPDVQNWIASVIVNDLFLYEDVLNWKGVPKQDQLEALAELIFEYLSESTLRYYGIFSGKQLAWHINELRTSESLGTYIESCVENRGIDDEVSDAIERALRFVRNVICHRLPKDIKVIQEIQSEILPRYGRDCGDYSKFCEQLEHLFIPANLFALDEYGIPIQTAARLESFIGQPEDLDTALDQLSQLDVSPQDFSPFEIGLIRSLQGLLARNIDGD
ncbi:DEAD/DEAH box helicase [Ruegeria sp. EL01]|uniref:DEAD/DEAH box helicase n=1 Tax=Ruegeria sp. EL01 TaxID=2107578 RepID=UPI000EA7FFEB|nr:DEAD/DEAH box helicase [Ruegeria sp. EL01]